MFMVDTKVPFFLYSKSDHQDKFAGGISVLRAWEGNTGNRGDSKITMNSRMWEVRSGSFLMSRYLVDALICLLR